MGKWSKFHTALLFCILLFIGVGLFVLQPDREEYPPYVSFSPAPEGTKAVMLWLEENGVPVREWNQSWRFLPQDGNHTVVLIQPFTAFEQEQEWMLEWIAEGNELILFAEEPAGWPIFDVQDTQEDGEGSTDSRLSEGGRKASSGGSIGQQNENEKVGQRSDGESVGEEGPETEMEWLGLGEEADEVKIEVIEELEAEEVGTVELEAEENENLVAISSPRWGEEYRGKVDTSYRLDVGDHEDTEVLLTDKEGILAMEKTVGEGRMSVFLTPDWLTNEFILEHDHLEMVQPLFEQEFEALWIDEYHHGYQEDPGIWAVYPTMLLIIAVQVVIAVLLWLWWKGKRFGRSYVPREWRVRRGDETLLAVASWYERGRLQQEALHHQGDYVRQLLLEKWGVSPQVSTDAIVHVAEDRWPKEQVQELWRVLQYMQDRDRRKSLSNKQFLQESERINQIIERLEKE